MHPALTVVWEKASPTMSQPGHCLLQIIQLPWSTSNLEFDLAIPIDLAYRSVMIVKQISVCIWPVHNYRSTMLWCESDIFFQTNRIFSSGGEFLAGYAPKCTRQQSQVIKLSLITRSKDNDIQLQFSGSRKQDLRMQPTSIQPLNLPIYHASLLVYQNIHKKP